MHQRSTKKRAPDTEPDHELCFQNLPAQRGVLPPSDCGETRRSDLPKPRSRRQDQILLARSLRSKGHTWQEIAVVFRDRYLVNARTAHRLARGWSQREVADRWTARWPADPKTFKNISYWETWPARSGYEPSLSVLAKLAELYECGVADLVVDVGDFQSADQAQAVRRALKDLNGLALAPPADSSTRDPQPDGLAELANRLEATDVTDISRTAAAWMRRLPPTRIDRRALLLKLSAGLSVAASLPVFHDDTAATTTLPTAAGDSRLDGIWLSRYSYHSSSRNEDLTGEHYVALRAVAGGVTGESLPHSTGSELRMDLTIEGSLITGTWIERTSPTGHYAGATYHGTIQLVADLTDRRMEGQWIGFGKNFKINNGRWTLTFVDGNLSRRGLQQYELAL